MKDSNILIDRYASSLYAIASKDSVAAAIYANMLRLADCLAHSEDYKKLALSKQVPKKIKSQIWLAVLEAVDAPEMLKSFVKLLLENGRISLFPKIIDKYNNLLLVDQGIKPVAIYTSFKLSATEHKDLMKQLEKIAGQKVQLESHVDESLLGGMILRIDSFMLDASIKAKLNTIKQTLLS